MTPRTTWCISKCVRWVASFSSAFRQPSLRASSCRRSGVSGVAIRVVSSPWLPQPVQAFDRVSSSATLGDSSRIRRRRTSDLLGATSLANASFVSHCGPQVPPVLLVTDTQCPPEKTLSKLPGLLQNEGEIQRNSPSPGFRLRSLTLH